jgi:DNA-binding XRE family transcriptional regulator
MKNTQQQAKEMYFQSGLSKTEIAEKLGISRRTIYQWSADGNWEKLRQSARNMPIILAKKVYYLIGHLTDQMLQKDPSEPMVTKEDVNMLSKLTNILCKLRKGSTVSENMETFTHLLERMNGKNPELAQQVKPHLDEYIEARGGKSEKDFLLAGFNENGTLPLPENDLMDKWEDEEEQEKMRAEKDNMVTASAAPVAKTGASAGTTTSPLADQQGEQKTGSTQIPTNNVKAAPKGIFTHYRVPEKKYAKETVAA